MEETPRSGFTLEELQGEFAVELPARDLFRVRLSRRDLRRLLVGRGSISGPDGSGGVLGPGGSACSR
jgi:hypothetical protein